jgi:hypothetical protein
MFASTKESSLRARRLLVILAILASPLIVFYPIVFSGYTFS